jgi:hypothetical protein
VTNVLDNNGTLTLPPPPTWTTVSTDESAWPTFASVYFDAQARLRRLITIVGNDAKIGGNPIIVDSRNASASGPVDAHIDN